MGLTQFFLRVAAFIITAIMLRTGAYRLWRASECASVEINSLGAAALRCMPQFEGSLVTAWQSRSYSAAAGEEEGRPSRRVGGSTR